MTISMTVTTTEVQFSLANRPPSVGIFLGVICEGGNSQGSTNFHICDLKHGSQQARRHPSAITIRKTHESSLNKSQNGPKRSLNFKKCLIGLQLDGLSSSIGLRKFGIDIGFSNDSVVKSLQQF